MNLKTMTERDLLRAALNELYHNLISAREAKQRAESALQRTMQEMPRRRQDIIHYIECYTDRVTKLEAQCAELRALLQNTEEAMP